MPIGILLSAIGINTAKPREDRTAYDLLTDTGKKIEVKCSAYLQSWNTEKLSRIQFSIHPARSWDPVNDYSKDRCGKQKSISLNALLSLKPEKATYEELRYTIEK